jgi:hypothetical protein
MLLSVILVKFKKKKKKKENKSKNNWMEFIIDHCRFRKPHLLLPHTISAKPDIATAAWSHAFKLHGPKKIQVDASSDVRNMAQVNRTANFLNGLTPHSVKAVAIIYLH